MPLPPLAEEILQLLDRPGVTPMERTILKLSATLLSEAGMGYEEFEKLDDPRLRMSDQEYFSLPDRFELREGRKAVPKEWELPQRVEITERNEQRIEELMAQGKTHLEAVKIVYNYPDTIIVEKGS